MRYHVDPKVDPHAPQKSWWIEPTTRQQFEAALQKESLRMRLSKLSRQIPSPILAWSEVKGRPQR